MNQDRPDRLIHSPTTRNMPVIVFRSSHSINPSCTVTKYFHWRLLKHPRNASRYWLSCSDRHTIGLGMFLLSGFCLCKPIILFLEVHTHSIQLLKCKHSAQYDNPILKNYLKFLIKRNTVLHYEKAIPKPGEAFLLPKFIAEPKRFVPPGGGIRGSLPQVRCPIHIDDRTGGELGPFGGEEKDCIGDLFRTGNPVQRALGTDLPSAFSL